MKLLAAGRLAAPIGCQAQAGSTADYQAYLRIYPDDEIVVAVMMNDDVGSQSAKQLGQEIGALVLASMP